MTKNYSKYSSAVTTDYSDYWDWFDKSWKRKMEFPAVKGFPFQKKEKKEQFLEDELFDI